jgi:hypothetical protein
MRRFAALVLALLIAAPAFSSTVQPTLVVPGQSQGVKQTGNADGSAHVFTVNPDLTTSKPNAIGPTSFRENVVFRDSSAQIPLLGARKVGLWFYVVPDTSFAGSLDSINNAIHWYALGINMNLTAANDSTVKSPWTALRQVWTDVAGNTGTRLVTTGGTLATFGEYNNLPIGAVNMVTTLLPGEILIPLASNVNGVGGSRYVELCIQGGCFSPERASFTLRSFGRWRNNPQATFIRNPLVKTRVRMDVLGLK